LDAIIVRLMEQIDAMKATIDAHVIDALAHPHAHAIDHEHEAPEPEPEPEPESEPEPVTEELPPPAPEPTKDEEEERPERAPERRHPLHGTIGAKRD
jgi:outer membrane biosynthesis protein TonB